MQKPIYLVGGKTFILREILDNIPFHKTYVEPFFGGGTVFFAKPSSHCEIINDKDDRLVTFYRVLQDEAKTKKLLRKIFYTPISDSEFAKAKEVLQNRESYEDVDIAHAVFVMINISHMHAFEPIVKRPVLSFSAMKNNFLRAKESIIYAVSKLFNVHITNRDALELIQFVDRPDVFIFCDPPYSNAYDFYNADASEAFHQELVYVLKNIKHAKVMLTNYPSDLYFQELSKWRIIKKDLPCYQAFTSSRKHKPTKRSKRTEVIFMNYDLTK